MYKITIDWSLLVMCANYEENLDISKLYKQVWMVFSWEERDWSIAVLNKNVKIQAINTKVN